MASESYGYESREISVEEIRFDPDQNPRNLRPPPELIRQIRDKGVKDSPIVYFNTDSQDYFAVNGWQRVQAARLVGLKKIMCEVYESELKAQLAAIHEDTRTEETELQQYKRFYSLYRSAMKEGMSESEAVHLAMTARGLSQIDAAWRRIDIFKLSPIVLSLMKEKENRTKAEWSQLEKINPNIRRVSKKLGIIAAATIATELDDRSSRVNLAVGMLCLKFKIHNALRFITYVSDNPGISPVMLYDRFTEMPSEEIHVKIAVNKKLKDKINILCEITHQDLNQIFREFLVNLLPDNKPKERLMDVGLKEAYFDVGKYRVIISPTVSIKGTPSIFYTLWDVKGKAWNSNVKLPAYLKKFLENLTMQIVTNLKSAEI